MQKYKCGINENGHSYEIVNGEPMSDFSALDPDEQETAKRWIKKVCKPAVALNKYHTSYGLKHILEGCTGVYMTNNQFKDLMLICGFKPKYEHELNWIFYIQERPFTKIEKWRRSNHSFFKPEYLDEFFALDL